MGLFLIMGCGVTSPDDVRRYFDLGADAVSLCTLALRDWREADRHYPVLLTGGIES